MRHALNQSLALTALSCSCLGEYAEVLYEKVPSYSYIWRILLAAS